MRILITEGLAKRGYDVSAVLEAEGPDIDEGSARNMDVSQLDLRLGTGENGETSRRIAIEYDLGSGRYSQSEIARRYGCSRQNVSQVKRRMSTGARASSGKKTTGPRRNRSPEDTARG